MDNRSWMRDALCAQSSPDLWFPEGSLHEVNAEARRICKKCPVIDECLGYALTNNEDHGIWGGLAANERKLLKRRARR
jgi:WhiB family redox-sensing transcriptional regulator